MKYADIKVSTSIETKIITFKDKEIIIKQSLSRNDMYDLIMITLQESQEGVIYNPFKLDTFFHVNLIMMITNIEFEAEDRINKFDTYDELYYSGLMDLVLENFPSKVYQYLKNIIEQTVTMKEEFESRAAALISQVIQDLPKNAEAAAKIVENFDPEQYQKVIDFATAANGGRPIVE